MILKKILIFITLFCVSDSYSQLRPESFILKDEANYLSKFNSQNPASNSITDVIAIGDTVWIGTSRGVSVSFDRGENWNNFYNTAPFGEDGITSIGYYKGMFWAATVTTADAPGGGTVPKGTGLKYTTDNGLNWTAVPQPIDNSSDSSQQYGINTLRVLPITVAEQNVTYDIAFTPGTVWITSFAGGLRKSSDMGQTWERVILPTDSLNSVSPNDTLSERDKCISPTDGNFCGEGWLNYRAFSVIAVNETTLYVGTANGINKSTDNGISWVKFTHQNQENPISGNFIVALGHDSTQSDDRIWTATWRAEDNQEFYGVSYSTDGGENWNTFLEDERVHNFGYKSSNVIAPSDNGAFRSSSPYSVWILPNSIFDRNGLSLTTNIFYSSASQDNDIWLGTSDGLAKNINSLNGWTSTWRIYFASQPLSSKRETYAFPNPFSPRQEVVDLKYSTGGKRSMITIRIFDFAMNYIRSIVQNAERGSSIHEVDNYNLETNGVIDTWDGRDENGNIVPNGVYFYRIDFDNDDPVFGKIIVLQ
jgi:ligand-binding sensor domain-containing protein